MSSAALNGSVLGGHAYGYKLGRKIRTDQPKIASTVRYLRIAVDGALKLAEKIEVYSVFAYCDTIIGFFVDKQFDLEGPKTRG